ncbi:protein kinase [Spirillospora sp. NPDC050679]
MLNVPLKPSFRYVHEPLDGDEDALPPLGDPGLADRLGGRVRHSRGGTFLITGFRGVGKTTLVRRTLRRIAEQSGPGEIVVPVALSVARSTTTERLLFAVVRRIFETLNDTGSLARLSPQTRQSLLLAYTRTSLSFKETQSEARERGATLDLGAGSGKGARALVDAIVPKATMSAKRTRSLATEAAFLAYSETDVEHDLMRIVALLRREEGLARRRRWPRRPPPPVRPRLVIVLDEIDKLTVDEAGRTALEALLGGMKNVLTMPGVHFVVVAGPDLHDLAVHDAARGDGVYESVFGWHLYVPCSWDAPDRLVADVVDGSGGAELWRFVQYLRFKARGVPRRLLQEFNRFVHWEDGRPWLRVGPGDEERITFYARLEGVLQEFFDQGARRLMAIPIDEDRWRLAGYYAVDRALRREDEPFSAAELLREGHRTRLDPLQGATRQDVERLLDHLAAEGIVEVVRDPSATGTIIGDVPEAQARVYRLTADVRRTLLGLAARHEGERGALEDRAPARPAPPPGTARTVGGRYELRNLIALGGMGEVWEGRDLSLGRPVAIKQLRAAVAGEPDLVAMVRREMEIAGRLRHPRIVRTLDSVDVPGGVPAMVMELLTGPTLKELLAERGTLPGPQTALVAHRLAGALAYLAEQRVVQLDMKPGNIIMRAPADPVIIDLGLAWRLGDGPAFPRGSGIIGTPLYMAPELFTGEDADARSDLYSFGLVLYCCLAGDVPWYDADAMKVAREAAQRRLDLTALPVSPEFRAALAPLVALDRDDRYDAPADFLAALEATPEWLSQGEPAPGLEESWDDAVTYRFPRQARAERPS